MYPLENWIETAQGIAVPTSEHAYQAAKFEDPELHALIAETRTGKFEGAVRAKELAWSEELAAGVRVDWEEVKLSVMEQVLRQKYAANPELAERLIATGDQHIAEGNNWRDRFWGVDPVGSTEGLNFLGLAHMKLRREYRAAA